MEVELSLSLLYNELETNLGYRIPYLKQNGGEILAASDGLSQFQDYWDQPSSQVLVRTL